MRRRQILAAAKVAAQKPEVFIKLGTFTLEPMPPEMVEEMKAQLARERFEDELARMAASPEVPKKKRGRPAKKKEVT